MTDYTLFQQLVENSQVDAMISDLEETNWSETERLELALPISEEDAPRILEELEEIRDRNT